MEGVTKVPSSNCSTTVIVLPVWVTVKCRSNASSAQLLLQVPESSELLGYGPKCVGPDGSRAASCVFKSAVENKSSLVMGTGVAASGFVKDPFMAGDARTILGNPDAVKIIRQSNLTRRINPRFIKNSCLLIIFKSNLGFCYDSRLVVDSFFSRRK